MNSYARSVLWMALIFLPTTLLLVSAVVWAAVETSGSILDAVLYNAVPIYVVGVIPFAVASSLITRVAKSDLGLTLLVGLVAGGAAGVLSGYFLIGDWRAIGYAVPHLVLGALCGAAFAVWLRRQPDIGMSDDSTSRHSRLVSWGKEVQSVTLIVALRDHSVLRTLESSRAVVESMFKGQRPTIEFPNLAALQRFEEIAESMGVVLEALGQDHHAS